MINRRKFIKNIGIASGVGIGIPGGCTYFSSNSEESKNTASIQEGSVQVKFLKKKSDSLAYTKIQNWKAVELWKTSTSGGLQFKDGAIVLEDQVLIENDAPGLGAIDDGSWQIIKSGIVLRKTLFIDHLPGDNAILTMLIYPLDPSEAMSGGRIRIQVNENKPVIQEVKHFWTRTSIPPEHLKAGRNVVVVTVADEKSQFRMPLASYSNFKYGTKLQKIPRFLSERSLDDGKTWSSIGLGDNNSMEGEYPIRLKLEHYRKAGWMETCSIDLGPSHIDEVFRFPAIVDSLQISLNTELQEGSRLVVKIRRGSTHQFEVGNWSGWKLLSGNDDTPEGGARYLQLRFEAVSDRRESTPIIKGFDLSSESRIKEVDWHKDINFVDSFNNPLIHSSFDFKHENSLLPALQQFRTDFHLDDIVAKARTEFEIVLKLRNWVAGKWEWFLPSNNRPPQTHWNATEILNDVDENGTYKKPGGYCLYYSIVLAQACQSYGIPARIVNLNYGVMGGHEVVEIWSRDFGKWVMMDPNFDSMFVCTETGTPLNVLELHRIFLKTYYPEGEVIDRDSWTDADRDRRSQSVDPSTLPLRMQTDNKALSGKLRDYVWWKITEGPAPGYSGGYGFFNTAFVRWLPRSNWLSQPGPMPINHGRTHWGWGDYLAWTDSQTPATAEHRYFVRRESDLYGNLFSVDFIAEPLDKRKVLKISMATDSPNFDHFQVNDNNLMAEVKSTEYLWELSTGRNRLEMRVVDTLGNKGPISYLVINSVSS